MAASDDLHGLPIVCVRGDDAVLVRDEARRIVDELVGDGDRGLLVTEFEGDDYELRSVVDAAQTLPFLTDRRVVVARTMERFNADDLAVLVEYLRSPLETSRVVAVWQGGGRFPKAVQQAVEGAGGRIIQTNPATGKGGRRQWFDEHLGRAEIRLDAAARQLLDDTVGEDLARVPALLETLTSTFGPGTKVTAVELAPFLGAAGAVPPWELTDAIDRGDVAEAVSRLRRMLAAGERHPLQIMVTLTTHVERMLALSGSGVRTEADAAARLGMKGSTFPAKKAMQQGQKLGPAKVGKAIELLADADLDLRGASAWSSDLVMEVLVARLARLAR